MLKDKVFYLTLFMNQRRSEVKKLFISSFANEKKIPCYSLKESITHHSPTWSGLKVTSTMVLLMSRMSKSSPEKSRVTGSNTSATTVPD